MPADSGSRQTFVRTGAGTQNPGHLWRPDVVKHYAMAMEDSFQGATIEEADASPTLDERRRAAALPR